jgi:3-oxoacyl-[acyl-carrier protein] reductase
MGELDGRVALVTGAGRGIGAEAARMLSEAGASVLVSDIDFEEAAAVSAALPGPSEVHAADLTKGSACDDVVAAAIAAWGQLDIVVNNAGYAWDGPIHKVSDEQFQAMLDIHTVVPFRILRAAAPHLREPAKRERAEGIERFRKVVNVVSLAGVMGNAGQVAYAAGKGATVGLTRSLAKEWGAFKINVNAVAFGFIETRLTADLPEQARAAFAASIPLGRGATPEEAARGIYYLCSPGSDYVHGQVLGVSGGLAVGMAG